MGGIDQRRFYAYTYERPRPNQLKLKLITYKVKSETPKGLWLTEVSPSRRSQPCGLYQAPGPDVWINPKTRRAKAYPTKELAMASFLRRKHGWLQRLQHQVRMAEAMIRQGELMSEEPTILDPNYVPPRTPSMWDDY